MNVRSYRFFMKMVMMKKLLFCFFSFALSLHAAISVDRHEHPIPVIIDSDCDLDDMMAIAYLVNSPRTDIKAITTVGDGSSRWEYGAKNMLNLLELLGHPRIPVSYGARESLSPVGTYPKIWRDQADAVSGIKLPHNPVQPQQERSAELLADIALKSPQKITILCLGPLTNLAIAFRKQPEIKEKIERILIKGGAILSPGDLEGKHMGFQNRVAEYNIFLDGEAANIVFESGIPITLIPIDVIEHVPSKQVYEMISSNRKTPAANFVYEVLKPSGITRKRYRGFLWEPIAAVLLSHPDIGTYRELRLMVYLKKGPEYAKLIMNKRGVPIQVVTSVDTKAFDEIFLETLNRPPNLQSGHVKTH